MPLKDQHPEANARVASLAMVYDRWRETAAPDWERRFRPRRWQRLSVFFLLWDFGALCAVVSAAERLAAAGFFARH